MKFVWLVCLALVGVTIARPSQGGGYHRLAPRRTVMISGLYANPLFGRSFDFIPHGSMSAVVTRDTVATNSFAGDVPQYPPVDILPVEENETVEQYTEKASELIPPQYIPPEAPVQSPEPQEVAPTLPVQQEPLEEVVPTLPAQQEVEVAQEELLTPPAVPSDAPLVEEVALAEEVSTEKAPVAKAAKRAPKKVKPPPVPVAEEEEEEDEALPSWWPFAGGKGAAPSYNAFFPINISGGPASRTRSQGADEDSYPGSATAIANSFSTGKGGIATSHATSFGDPYLASLIRKGLLNLGGQKP